MMDKQKTIADNSNNFIITNNLTVEYAENIKKEFECFLEKVIMWQKNEIVIIFHENIKCDGAGLALLIECKKYCINHKIMLYLQGVQSHLKNLMEFYGIINFFVFR